MFLRTPIRIALAAVVAAVALNSGMEIVRDYRDTVAAGRSIIRDMASVVDYHVQRTVHDAVVATDRLNGIVAESGGVSKAGTEDNWQKMREIADRLPGASSLWIFDTAGNTVLESGGFPGREVNAADREYFQSALRDEPLFVGPAVRAKTANRRIFFTVSRPLHDRDGKVSGLAVAAMHADYLTDFFDLLGFAMHSTITVFRQDGTVVARRPNMEQFVGSRNISGPLFTEQLPRSPKGDFDSVSPFDGKTRFASYRTAAGLGLVIFVGVEPDVILAPWLDRSLTTAAQSLFSLVLIGGITIWGTRALGRAHETQAKLREDVRDREQKLEAIVRNSPAPLYLKDIGGRYVAVSASLIAMLNRPEAQVLGKTAFDVFPDHTASAVQANDQIVLADKAVHSFEEDLIVDGEVRTCISHKFPILDDAGNISFLCGISLDVTDRRRAEQSALQAKAELLHASRLTMVGEVASTIAHEVNQPLGAVSNYLQVAQMLISDPASLRILEKAAEQAQRAAETVRKVKAFASNRGVEPTPATLRPVVEDSLSLALLGSAGKSVTTEIDIPESLPQVIIDRVQIQQVLLNLFRNAVEAMANSDIRTISVQARPSGAMVEISVVDSGPGIADGAWEKLFQPFATTKADGTGLGLSTSRSIIQAHGGHLRAQKGAGGGAVFSFTLPATTA